MLADLTSTSIDVMLIKFKLLCYTVELYIGTSEGWSCTRMIHIEKILGT